MEDYISLLCNISNAPIPAETLKSQGTIYQVPNLAAVVVKAHADMGVSHDGRSLECWATGWDTDALDPVFFPIAKSKLILCQYCKYCNMCKYCI